MKNTNFPVSGEMDRIKKKIEKVAEKEFGKNKSTRSYVGWPRMVQRGLIATCNELGIKIKSDIFKPNIE